MSPNYTSNASILQAQYTYIKIIFHLHRNMHGSSVMNLGFIGHIIFHGVLETLRCVSVRSDVHGAHHFT
jgi:hypothetical protein